MMSPLSEIVLEHNFGVSEARMGACAAKEAAPKQRSPSKERFSAGNRSQTARAAKRERTEALVKGTVSATSFTVQIGTRRELFTIKLRGISSGKNAATAKAELGRLLNTKTVTLDIWDKSKSQWLCDVYCAKVDLVKRGLASVDEDETRAELVQAQDGAKRGRMGMWKGKDFTTSDERKRLKSNSKDRLKSNSKDRI